MTIGESLKRARKKMGLDLDEVVHATKIAKMFLIALENDDISSLPPGVYARNFLRTYARFLKLDEDILTAEYHEQFAIKPQFVTQQEQTKLDNQHYMRRRNRRVSLLSGLLLIPMAFYGLYVVYQDHLPDLGSFIPQFQTKTQAPQPAETSTSLSPSAPSKIQQPPVETPSASVSTQPNTPTDSAGTEPEPPAAGAIPPTENPTSDPSPAEVTLPLTSLQGVTVYPLGVTPQSLSEVFVIAARTEPVKIKVEIDDKILSSGTLQPGEYRCFAYGQKHILEIDNLNQVSIQDGNAFREVASPMAVNILIGRLKPGALFETIDQRVNLISQKKKENIPAQETP